MKRKLIIKLTAGFLLFILLNWLIRSVFDPSFCYGNETLHQKLEEFNKDPGRYNTIMIGSSCFFWNLNTDQFDSLMPPEWNVCSYNFGSGGTLPPETYDFLDKLLKRHKGSIDRVIIELRDISLFPEHHRQTVRKRYFMTPGWYSFIVRANLKKNSIPDKERINNIQQYGIALLERWLNTGYFNDIYGKSTETITKAANRKQNLIKRGVRGFLSLQKQHEETRTRLFLADTTFLTIITEKHRAIRNNNNNLQANNVHFEKIMRIVETCNKQGIHCVFLMHPKQQMVHLKETIALAESIPHDYLIDISDPDLFPELYLAANSINRNHFNRRGTRIFTNLAALNFKAIHTVWLKKIKAH